MTKINNRFKNKIFPAVVLTMVIATMVIVVGMGMSIPFQFTFALTEEQNELGRDDDGKKKSYSDCKGFAEMMERAGVPKNRIGLNYDWVQARMLAMPNLISTTSDENEKEGLQEEFDCLLAVRAMNIDADGPGAKVCEALRQEATGVKCLFDGLSGVEPIPSSVSSESGEGGDNWTEYTNSNLGISFEYPPFGKLTEKTNRFLEGPDVEILEGQRSFKFFDHSSVVDKGLEFADLEYLADATTDTFVNSPEKRLIEDVSMDGFQIDDKNTATFLFVAAHPFSKIITNNLDLAAQVFLVENDGRVYTLIYQDLVTRFDTDESQERMQNILNSFKFIDSENDSENEEENVDEDNDNN